MNIKILVATHKKYQMPEGKIYIPLHVGAEGKEALGYTKDNSGDHISKKNDSFCELSGLYWGWKNLAADYLGLVHYRRYFTRKKFFMSYGKDKMKLVLSDKEAGQLCEKYDVIIPRKRQYYIESLYSHYKHTHYACHLDETMLIIQEKYPEYVEMYKRVLKQTNGYMFNMFIMKKNLSDAYCEWLFDILFELEKRINMPELSKFQGRFYGRVSEILFNAWLLYQMETSNIVKEKVCEIPCIHIERINWIKKGSAFLEAKFLNRKYEGSF